jgi:hypothetical protein
VLDAEGPHHPNQAQGRSSQEALDTRCRLGLGVVVDAHHQRQVSFFAGAELTTFLLS